MRILLLEDDTRDAQFLIKNLNDLGHDEVVWIRTKEEAYDHLENAEPYDLGIFDIDLRGEAVTGIDIGVKFIQKYGLPILFATSYPAEEHFVNQLLAAGLSQKYYRDKRLLENKDLLESILEEIIEDYDFPTPTQYQYLLFSHRKVGFFVEKNGSRGYDFFKKDEILFLKGNGDVTEIHLTDSKCLVSRNVGSVAKRISNVFYNIVKIDRSYYINLEQITRLEGASLYFTGGKNIKLSSAGKQFLRKNGLLITAK